MTERTGRRTLMRGSGSTLAERPVGRSSRLNGLPESASGRLRRCRQSRGRPHGGRHERRRWPSARSRADGRPSIRSPQPAGPGGSHRATGLSSVSFGSHTGTSSHHPSSRGSATIGMAWPHQDGVRVTWNGRQSGRLQSVRAEHASWALAGRSEDMAPSDRAAWPRPPKWGQRVPGPRCAPPSSGGHLSGGRARRHAHARHPGSGRRGPWWWDRQRGERGHRRASVARLITDPHPVRIGCPIRASSASTAQPLTGGRR